MFTRNWYYGLATQMANGSYSPSEYNLINLSGAKQTTISGLSNWTNLCNTTSSYIGPSMNYPLNSVSSGAGVVFGNGTTAPSLDDFDLAGDMFTTFSYSKSVSVAHDATETRITGTYTLTNTGTSDFTISECGVIAACANNSASSYKCLLERTVLEEPITIPAGGIGVVTYTIRIKYPT